MPAKSEAGPANAPVAPNDWAVAKTLPALTAPIEACIRAARDPALTPPAVNPTAGSSALIPVLVAAPAGPNNQYLGFNGFCLIWIAQMLLREVIVEDIWLLASFVAF